MKRRLRTTDLCGRWQPVACGREARINLGASAEARFDLRIKKDPNNSGPRNAASSPLP